MNNVFKVYMWAFVLTLYHFYGEITSHRQ